MPALKGRVSSLRLGNKLRSALRVRDMKPRGQNLWDSLPCRGSAGAQVGGGIFRSQRWLAVLPAEAAELSTDLSVDASPRRGEGQSPGSSLGVWWVAV